MTDKNNSANIISGCHNNQADNYDERIFKAVEDKQNFIREKYFEVHQEVLNFLNLNDGEMLLDIGIGTGLLEEKIKCKVKIFGIDISEKMLGKLKEKNLNNVQFIQGSFLNIPFGDRMFDSIVSCFAFHHLSDTEKIRSIFEMKRILKDKGRIVIGDFMYLNEAAKISLITKFRNEKRNDMTEEMDEENFTNIEDFKIILEENGFDVKYKQVSTISWVIKAELTGSELLIN